MHKTHSIKKAQQAKNKRLKKETLERVFAVCTNKRWEYLLYLREKGDKIGISCEPFYPQERGWNSPLFSRDECEWLLLQLQHKLGGKSMGIRTKTWKHKSGGIIQIERSNTKSRPKMV